MYSTVCFVALFTRSLLCRVSVLLHAELLCSAHKLDNPYRNETFSKTTIGALSIHINCIIERMFLMSECSMRTQNIEILIEPTCDRHFHFMFCFETEL